MSIPRTNPASSTIGSRHMLMMACRYTLTRRNDPRVEVKSAAQTSSYTAALQLPGRNT